MLIIYKITVDDLVAYHERRAKNNPVSMRRSNRVILLATLSILIGLLCILTKTLGVLYGFLPFIGGLLSLRAGWEMRHHPFRKAIQKKYSEEETRRFLGLYSLEITEEGLIKRSEWTEMELAWGLIERIETTPEHTFVYHSTAHAVVIPHRAVTDGNLTDFLNTLNARYQAEKKRQSVIARPPQALTNFPPNVP